MTDDDPNGEAYGEVTIDSRGRLTIPAALRDDLRLEAGTTFAVVRDGNDIRLVRQIPALETVSSGKSRDEWGDEAFRDAGEAMFGGRDSPDD